MKEATETVDVGTPSSDVPVALPQWRKPVLNLDGTVDCEIEHERFGWIPFTASSSDAEPLGPALHDAITLSGQEIPNRVTPIGEIADRKRAEIEAALSAALASGMPYTMPDGSEDVIQTRPDQDEANLLGLAITARDLRTAGETGVVMELRAQSNTVYSLTPEQMIALTDAAKAFKQGLLAKSWKLKDQVTAAEAAGDREAIGAIVWET